MYNIERKKILYISLNIGHELYVEFYFVFGCADYVYHYLQLYVYECAIFFGL